MLRKTHEPANSKPWSFSDVWRDAVRISPALSISPSWGWRPGAALSLVGIFADPRVLMGVPLWLKPFKFFSSFALLFATLLLFLGHIDRRGTGGGAGSTRC